MIKITEENLKWAYKKLKYYIYYYKSLNYLKDKIYDFEQKYENDLKGFSDFFKETAAEFNNLKSTDNLNSKYRLNYLVYPKKDSIKFSGLKDYNVFDVNFFIDMDLKLYLVDILFTLSIYEETKDNGTNEFAFGNVFSKALNNVENIENPFLFENHKSQYKKWKNSIYKNLDSVKEKYAIVVKLDMQRCFYNFKFNFKDFTSKKIREIDSQILIIERFIYNRYTKQIYEDFPKGTTTTMGATKSENICILPIGIFSSYAIMNFYFDDLDKVITSNPEIINYGRYVDDILMLVEYNQNYAGKTGKELVSTVCSNALIMDTEQMFFECKSIGLEQSIPLQESKIKVQMVSIESLKSKKENLREMYAASLENDDRESCVQMNVDDIASLKNYFFNFEISNKKKIEKIHMMEDYELLNAYPIWKYLFNIMQTNNLDSGELKEKIQYAIENIVYSSVKALDAAEEKVTNWIIETMTRELNTAYSLIYDAKYKKYFIDDIDQLGYFSFIDSYKEQTDIYKIKYKYTFPLIISRELLMLYFAETLKVDNNYEVTITSEYKKINNINMYPLNLTISNSENISNICKADIGKIIEKIYMNDEGIIEKKVNIAVVNMNIPVNQIKEFDLQEKYPKSFDYSTIRKIIISASKHGACYVIFPEFAIPYHDAYKVIRLAKENRISIISGLTHKLYIEENDKTRVIEYKDKSLYKKVYAKNLTLIYDYYLHIVNFYVKKSFAPEEIKILLEHKLYGVPGNDELKVYHSIINYGVLTCFDATDIGLRGKYKNYVDTLFLPVMNRDTNYFSAIVKSLSRDLSAYVIQSNITEYGDSRITGPFETYRADIIKSKGGINCYYVLGIVDYTPLYNRLIKDKSIKDYIDSIKNEDGNDKHFKKYIELSSESKNETLSKPSSANIDYEKSILNQKENGIFSYNVSE